MPELRAGRLPGPAAGRTGQPVDATLDAVPKARRSTLIASPEPNRTYRFDIRLQGPDETVFLQFSPEPS